MSAKGTSNTKKPRNPAIFKDRRGLLEILFNQRIRVDARFTRRRNLLNVAAFLLDLVKDRLGGSPGFLGAIERVGGLPPAHGEIIIRLLLGRLEHRVRRPATILQLGSRCLLRLVVPLADRLFLAVVIVLGLVEFLLGTGGDFLAGRLVPRLDMSDLALPLGGESLGAAGEFPLRGAQQLGAFGGDRRLTLGATGKQREQLAQGGSFQLKEIHALGTARGRVRHRRISDRLDHGGFKRPGPHTGDGIHSGCSSTGRCTADSRR